MDPSKPISGAAKHHKIEQQVPSKLNKKTTKVAIKNVLQINIENSGVKMGERTFTIGQLKTEK